jgi:hypothetical protein
MNYVSFIVKIIQPPEQSFFEDDTSVTELFVKFPQTGSKNFFETIHLSFWGNLAYEIVEYYQVNDYILIEGYISLRENFSGNVISTNDKEIEISVFKVFPFILGNNNSKFPF